MGFSFKKYGVFAWFFARFLPPQKCEKTLQKSAVSVFELELGIFL